MLSYLNLEHEKGKDKQERNILKGENTKTSVPAAHVVDATKDRLKIYSCSGHGFVQPQCGRCCGSPSICPPLPRHVDGGDSNVAPPVPPYQTTISLVNSYKALQTGNVLRNRIIPTPARVHSVLSKPKEQKKLKDEPSRHSRRDIPRSAAPCVAITLTCGSKSVLSRHPQSKNCNLKTSLTRGKGDNYKREEVS